ncbi:GntR family transcriptional regulator [Desulfospira joergensenii]|uniref:GntR family transcriptional regulator n=1 Tax=Desulfospira joergensenii TaxID=53329 RepID=UPI0003B691BA|nr:GntR family transcriptional regulator [Desulfospira joergensenii]
MKNNAFQNLPKYRTNKEIPLIEWAYLKLKEMIFHQVVVPGQKLIYKDLCEALGLSRTPIINALTRLEQEGHVKSESFRGFYVNPISVKEITDKFGVREALEVYAIGIALPNSTPKDLEVLEDMILEHGEYNPPGYDKKKLYLDSRVHLQIAKMTGNDNLVDMLRMNLEHVYLRLALNTSNPSRMSPAIKEHDELLTYLKNKDMENCIRLMRKHIRLGRDHVINSLSKDESYFEL